MAWVSTRHAALFPGGFPGCPVRVAQDLCSPAPSGGSGGGSQRAGSSRMKPFFCMSGIRITEIKATTSMMVTYQPK